MTRPCNTPAGLGGRWGSIGSRGDEPMQDLMPGRKTAATSQPPAELDPRPGDIDLPLPLYQVKSLPGVSERTLRMNPGTLRLRRYRKGETICTQGEPGWTAFVLLTADDVRGMQAE